MCQIANYLRSVGVKRGDDVTIYMPMISELPAAMVPPCVCHSTYTHDKNCVSVSASVKCIHSRCCSCGVQLA